MYIIILTLKYDLGEKFQIIFFDSVHHTDKGFVSFLSGGFTTLAVVNRPERKLAKRTSVHCQIFIYSLSLRELHQNLTECDYIVVL